MKISDEKTRLIHETLRNQINELLIKSEQMLNKFEVSYGLNTKKISEKIEDITIKQRTIDCQFKKILEEFGNVDEKKMDAQIENMRVVVKYFNIKIRKEIQSLELSI